MFDKDSFVRCCGLVREQSPLVHCITNYVAMDFNANALLAIGASPLMSFCPEEIPDIVAACNSLLVNIGCLDDQQIAAMKSAVMMCRAQGKPWVLDPVGVGVSHLRKEVCNDLISLAPPAIIRGNPAEIMTLSGVSAHSCGADSRENPESAFESAAELARRTGSIVSVSGPVDFITDGDKCFKIAGGSPLMPRITAMGCTASAITAAFVAVSEPLDAATFAMIVMSVAGERAASISKGTGSFKVSFIDELSDFNSEDYFNSAKLCV